MVVKTVYLLTDERPHHILYICPVCSRENHDMTPYKLDNLSCRGCGATLDGSAAEICVLSQLEEKDTDLVSPDIVIE